MKLHPLSIPFNAVGRVNRGLLVSVTGVFLITYGTAGFRYLITFLLLYVGLFVVIEAVRWRNFSFRVDDESVVTRSDGLNQHHRLIPSSRIHQVSIERRPICRWFDLVAVSFETATDDEESITLRYLHEDSALEVRQRLGVGTDDASDSESSLIYQTPVSYVVGYALLQPHTVSVVFAVVCGWLVFFGPSIEHEAMTVRRTIITSFEVILPETPAFQLLVLGGAGWGVGAVLSLVKFGNFRLYGGSRTLRHRRGLVREEERDLPRKRIQVIRVTSNVAHRLLGLARADIGTASSTALLPFGLRWPLTPLTSKETAWELVSHVVDVERPSLERIPKRAQYRYVVRYGLLAIGLWAGTVSFYWLVADFSSILVVMALPLGLLLVLAARFEWAACGYHIDEDYVIIAYGFWQHSVYIVPTDKIQNVTVSHTLYQRRVGLATIELDVISLPFAPALRLPDVNDEFAYRMQDMLTDGFD